MAEAAVFSAAGGCSPVLETSGTGAVDGVGELVTRLPAARSAKVAGPNLYWAVVWQFLATWSVLWQFIYVTSSLLT
jgi:hypothetical protein